ncbi:hypothetical protein PC120_g25541 [Phytophthora cactorum]|nr:hypothetical protein PC120_g25541 [Phytophthora cactorum]
MHHYRRHDQREKHEEKNVRQYGATEQDIGDDK